jgi:tetratricopeptide (TPR) repeat protein
MPPGRVVATTPAKAPLPSVVPLAEYPSVAARTEAAALLAGAVEARERGDLRTTLALLQGAVERAPSVETHAELGALYLELGVPSAADSHLRAAAEAVPESADRWIALANALALKPDPIAAAEALDRAHAAEPDLRVARGTGGWLVREPPVPTH